LFYHSRNPGTRFCTSVPKGVRGNTFETWREQKI
jgi:hypothetical protein